MKKFFLFTNLFFLCLILGFSAQAKDVCGIIDEDTVWGCADSPIIVTCDVTVIEGVTLTIEPCVEVRFNEDMALIIEGTLIAEGTSDEVIIFTSNDVQEPGYWGYIFFADTSAEECILRYTTVEYGGSVREVIAINSSSPSIDNSRIINNNNGGIYVAMGSPVISNCEIKGNLENGISFSGDENSTLTVDNCDISGNSYDGIDADDGTVVSQNCTISGNDRKGIDAAYGTLTIDNCTISENERGIMADDCIVTIENCIISENNGTDNGGIAAFYGNVTIQNCTISENSEGGITAHHDSNVTIQNCTISGNFGSGIYAYGTVTTQNCTISGNTGSGISASGTATIDNCVISGNSYGISASGIVTIKRNRIIQNVGSFGVYLRDLKSGSVIGGDSCEDANVIKDNTGNGVYIDGNPAFNYNDIYNNGDYELVCGNESGADPLDATNIFWGTTEESEIKKLIWDCHDDAALGCVNYIPFLEEPCWPIIPPEIHDVMPSFRGQGATGQDIVVTGENFIRGADVSFSCDGITVYSTTWESDTEELIAHIDIAPDAPVGVCDVIVTNPGGETGTGENMFEVTTAPTVTSTNPDGLPQGSENQDVTIVGSGFVDNLPDDPNGDQLDADFGDGITVNSVTFVSSTELIANISIADDAEFGARDVEVVSGDAGVGIGVGIFTVFSAGGPTIDIHIDQEVYQPEDEMWVYADFSNHTDKPVGGIAALFLIKLSPILRLYEITFRFMPTGYEEQGYEFHHESSPPVDKPGTYAWLGVLFSRKDGYLDSSVAVWSYETSVSAADAERIRQIAEEYAQGLTLNAILNMKPAEGFEKDAFPIPAESMLFQNMPNPFNPETWIPYQLAEDTDVKIRIYNVTGKLVRTLDLGHKDAGLYLSKDKAAYWNGKDSLGQKVASGVYFYTLQESGAGEFKTTRKMIIIK